MLQQIGLNLQCLQRFPRLYPHNRPLEMAMVDVYQTIFDFLSEARDVFAKLMIKRGALKVRNITITRGSFRLILLVCLPVGIRTMSKLLWKPFKAQFNDIQENLFLCMERIEKEVDLAEKEEAHAERERAEKERRAQSFRWNKAEQIHGKLEVFLDDQAKAKVDYWLGLVDYESNHLAAMEVRHHGTGKWFLQGSVFQSWLENDNSFLWLKAIPGAGKTVLMSSAVEYLKENVQSPEVGLAYFYCDYRDSLKQQPSQILCTLLSQLAEGNKYIFQRVQSFFQEQYKENPGYTPRLEEIRGNFDAFLSNTFKQVLLVIDAVDECISHMCITQSLIKILETCPTVKFLVSSREEQDIAKAFRHLPRVKIKQSDVADDIESYVKFEVSTKIREETLRIRSHETEQLVCDKLVIKSEGM